MGGATFCLLILVVQPIALICGIQLSYIFTFCLGYFISRKGIKISDSLMIKLTAGCVLITVLRLFLMRILDGSMMYDRYIVQLSSAAIGIWIFFFIFWLSFRMPHIMSRIGESRRIVWLSNISFEIYIVHIWFLSGKWQVANYISNPIISDVVVLGLSVIFAWLLHCISQRIVKKLNLVLIKNGIRT